MTTVATHGFLSGETAASVLDFEEQHKSMCQLYRQIGAFAHRAKYKFRCGPRNVREILVALYFGRALSAYETVFLLASRGMNPDSQTALRTLVETMLHTIAADKSDENAKKIVLSSEWERQKDLNAAARHQTGLVPDGEITEINRQARELAEELKAKKIKRLKIWEVAEMASLDWVHAWLALRASLQVCTPRYPTTWEVASLGI